jgi:hypothetical protein
LRLAHLLSDRLGLRVAIETGTFLGDSARALGEVVPAVWSIELSPELHQAAKTKFIDRPNLHFAHGYSPAVLPGILASLSAPALFWLDGHWSGGETAGDSDECPVLDELRSIDAWPQASGSCVLIDDARLFLGPPPPPHDPSQWPTFIEVVDALRSTHARYVTVLEDVIIAGPPQARQIVEAYWLEAMARDAAEESGRAGWGELIRRGFARTRR